MSKARYTIMFFVSLIACIALLAVKPEWFWVMLPFVGTGLAGALDAI